ncbi:unnamed protein product, partial [Allacma fusca]
MGKGGGMIPVR